MEHVKFDGFSFNKKPLAVLQEEVNSQGYQVEKTFNEAELLWLPNLDRQRLERGVSDDHMREQYLLMKGLLTDPDIPGQATLYGEFVYDCGNSYEWVEDEFGRIGMIVDVGDLQLEELLDDLREVVLHDTHPLCPMAACEAIGNVGTEKAAEYLCDIAESSGEHGMWAAEQLTRLSYTSVGPKLCHILDKELEKVPDYARSVSFESGVNTLGFCIKALGELTTVDALEGLKKGVVFDNDHVQAWSRLALDRWIHKSLVSIADNSAMFNVEERTGLVKKTIIAYGIETRKSFYDTGRLPVSADMVLSVVQGKT
ncbi:hypothetical protein GOV04_01395 [Candidatus Woesearchaeota archaeon]|nr:hypothetical protein [Candidatus Woesearchaeota archaeon]